VKGETKRVQLAYLEGQMGNPNKYPGNPNKNPKKKSAKSKQKKTIN
jgi:hypothetical protein